ncbi:hypothetical protein X975_02689, partial [Stegodyphus mimosarum]
MSTNQSVSHHHLKITATTEINNKTQLVSSWIKSTCFRVFHHNQFIPVEQQQFAGAEDDRVTSRSTRRSATTTTTRTTTNKHGNAVHLFRKPLYHMLYDAASMKSM